MRFICLLFTLALAACAQPVVLTPPPPTPQPAALTSYVDSFPVSNFSTPGTVVTLSHPAKVGTVVTVFMRGVTFAVFDAFKKTPDPILLTVDVSLAAPGAQVVFVYQSEN